MSYDNVEKDLSFFDPKIEDDLSKTIKNVNEYFFFRNIANMAKIFLLNE